MTGIAVESGGRPSFLWRVSAVAGVMLMTLALFSACGGASGPASGPVGPATPSQATSGTPAAMPLPQTVSNAGLRITLVNGAHQGNQVWLTFRFESANPAQPNLWAVGGGGEIVPFLVPLNDIQATGMRWNQRNQVSQVLTPFGPHTGTPAPPPPPSPTPYPTPVITSYLYTLPYLLTQAPNLAVTVTIRRIRFDTADAAPGPGKIITGTWRFAFVPGSLPAPVPTSPATP